MSVSSQDHRGAEQKEQSGFHTPPSPIGSAGQHTSESILLSLPIECLANVCRRFADDAEDLFERQKSIQRFASVCQLFRNVAETIDTKLLVCSGIVAIRDCIPKLKEDPSRAERIHCVALKTLTWVCLESFPLCMLANSPQGAKIGSKGEESTAKSLPEKPSRIKDCFALLSLLPNLRIIDLRVNGKRGAIETKDLVGTSANALALSLKIGQMTPLKTLSCLECLESLSIDFPRAFDMNDVGFLETRREWVDFWDLLPRLANLKRLRLTNLGLTFQRPTDSDDTAPLPPCSLKVLEAKEMTNTFAQWLNGSSDMTVRLTEGQLSFDNQDETCFSCPAITELSLGRIEASAATRVSMPNLITLRATWSCEFLVGASVAFFSDMPCLQQLVLPISPSIAYSRTRANARAGRSNEEMIAFVRKRFPPIAELEVVSENWDTAAMRALEEVCAEQGTVLRWNNAYKRMYTKIRNV